MLITDVRAHHIRIPYDAGVASFRQGAASISALEIIMAEVSTDAGITGWGDAFAYVCTGSTRTAVEEMIAERAGESFVGTVVRIQRKAENIGSACRERLRGLAEPSGTHIAHH